MQTLSDLRLFYNHTIHPELQRMERRRHRVLTTITISFFLLMGLVLLQVYVNILVVTLLLMIPLVLYISYLISEWTSFKDTFKPKIVSLLLDYIDNDVTYNVPLSYIQHASISREVFISSRLFNTDAPEFEGEDYITGEMGELEFEMSELGIKEFSTVRNRLDEIFRGVFLHARFRRPVQESGGEILVLPRHRRQYLSKTIKSFTTNFGRQLDVSNLEFQELFIVYATQNANTRGFLSSEMQEAILKYQRQEGKNIYMSFIENDIYIAVEQDHDLLEPKLLQSNLSFDLVREFYQDITLLLSIVLDIDANN
jgi:hypothetical protein